MSFPMLENESGDFCYLNGQKVLYSSNEARDLTKPVSDFIYYESIRVEEGILLFFENHMLRLMNSIAAKEGFPVDTDTIFDTAMRMLNEAEPAVTEGNIRVVLTHDKTLIHFSHVFYPSVELYREGITTGVLFWERLDPHVKILRGEYKAAIAAKMSEETLFGLPYEVLLENSEGKLTEGGRSNFFVLSKGVVYSPPEELILIGITRRYVLGAIRNTGFKVEEKMFSLAELVRMRDEAGSADEAPALFVTSSPFDILPVRSIGSEVFQSSANPDLKRISDAYREIVKAYILSRSSDKKLNTPDENC